MTISNHENYVPFFSTDSNESYLLGVQYRDGNISIQLHLFNDNEEVYPFQTYSAYVFEVESEIAEEVIDNAIDYILTEFDTNCTRSEMIDAFHALVPVVEGFCR